MRPMAIRHHHYFQRRRQDKGAVIPNSATMAHLAYRSGSTRPVRDRCLNGLIVSHRPTFLDWTRRVSEATMQKLGLAHGSCDENTGNLDAEIKR